MFSEPSKEVVEHQIALGRLCYVWAGLDRMLNDLIAELMGISAIHAASIATQLDNVSGRCQLILRLIPTIDVGNWWKESVKKIIKDVDSLGRIRNRCIHDYWKYSDGNLIRIDRRVVIKKEKSFGDDQSIFDIEHTMEKSDIENLNAGILMSILGIKGAILDFQQFPGKSTPAPETSRLQIVADALADIRRDRLTPGI